MELKDAYRLLEIEPGATETEARSAYKALARLWHPDRFSRDSSLRAIAEANMKDANEAFQIVKPHLVKDRPSSSSKGLIRPSPPEGSGTRGRFRRTTSDAPGTSFAKHLAERVAHIADRLDVEGLIQWLRRHRPAPRRPWYQYEKPDDMSLAQGKKKPRFERLLGEALKRSTGQLQRPGARGLSHRGRTLTQNDSGQVEPVEPIRKLDEE
jgi:hypothetical protein